MPLVCVVTLVVGEVRCLDVVVEASSVVIVVPCWLLIVVCVTSSVVPRDVVTSPLRVALEEMTTDLSTTVVLHVRLTLVSTVLRTTKINN